MEGEFRGSTDAVAVAGRYSSLASDGEVTADEDHERTQAAPLPYWAPTASLWRGHPLLIISNQENRVFLLGDIVDDVESKRIADE